MPDSSQGAPERPPAARAATAAPTEAPEPSEARAEYERAVEEQARDALENGTIQAVVSDQHEGAVRMVQSGHDPKRWDGPTEKLELVTKVGNRKHTAMILGETAQRAVDAGIKVGDVVRFTNAAVEEIKWAEDKPTKKEIWGQPALSLGVMVMRDGEWVSVTGPSSAGASSTEPSTVPSATTTSPAPSAPTRRHAPDGQVEMTLRVKLLEPIAFKIHPRTNEAVASLKGVDPDTGEIVFAAMGGDDNVQADLGTPGSPFYDTGDTVQLVGTWQGGWVVLTTVGKPA
jgi:hypothetical protein